MIPLLVLIRPFKASWLGLAAGGRNESHSGPSCRSGRADPGPDVYRTVRIYNAYDNLDLHPLFRCTNDVQFYVRLRSRSNFGAASDWYIQTPYNYHRALVWTAVMTTLSHLDPVFSNVFAIEAVNEPIADATKTPGYGDCMLRVPSLVTLF